MWGLLENSGWVKTLADTGWMYATVSVIHYLTFFWCVGSMAVVDLRVMGLVAKKVNLGKLASQLFPLAWAGFILAIMSGFLMFATDATDWAPDPVFHVKLTLMILSLFFSILVQKYVRQWAAEPKVPAWGKFIAIIALLLWISTILSASEIPAKEGLG